MISELSGTTRDNSVTYGLIIDLHPIKSSAVLLLDSEWVKKWGFCVFFNIYSLLLLVYITCKMDRTCVLSALTLMRPGRCQTNRHGGVQKNMKEN